MANRMTRKEALESAWIAADEIEVALAYLPRPRGWRARRARRYLERALATLEPARQAARRK